MNNKSLRRKNITLMKPSIVLIAFNKLITALFMTKMYSNVQYNDQIWCGQFEKYKIRFYSTLHTRNECQSNSDFTLNAHDTGKIKLRIYKIKTWTLDFCVA